MHYEDYWLTKMTLRPLDPYVSRLQADLAGFKGKLDALLDISTIRYVNPNRPGGDVFSWALLIGGGSQ